MFRHTPARRSTCSIRSSSGELMVEQGFLNLKFFYFQLLYIFRRLPFYEWFSSLRCSKHQEKVASHGNDREYIRPNREPKMQSSSDSIRTLTTSFTIGKQSCTRPYKDIRNGKPKTNITI